VNSANTTAKCPSRPHVREVGRDSGGSLADDAFAVIALLE
jgi:hypothetical protein